MKSIISLMAVASVVFFANGQTLEDVYKKVCKGQAYTTTDQANVTTTATKYEPWEALLGYALGTQASPTDEGSTCFGQMKETYKFLDTMVFEAYDIINKFDVNSLSSRVQSLAQNINNFVIQLSDQNIACQDGVKVKQLATRTSKVSGLFNWAFTIAYSLTFDDYIKPHLGFLPVPETNQRLKTSIYDLIDQIYDFVNVSTIPDCRTLGYNWGVIVSESLEAKTESFVQFIEV